MAEPKKITEIWLWVITEPDGGEGVPASSNFIPGHVTPLIGADEDRALSFRPEAIRIAAIDGLPLKLLCFRNGEVVETLKAVYDA